MSTRKSQDNGCNCAPTNSSANLSGYCFDKGTLGMTSASEVTPEVSAPGAQPGTCTDAQTHWTPQVLQPVTTKYFYSYSCRSHRKMFPGWDLGKTRGTCLRGQELCHRRQTVNSDVFGSNGLVASHRYFQSCHTGNTQTRAFCACLLSERAASYIVQ